MVKLAIAIALAALSVARAEVLTPRVTKGGVEIAVRAPAADRVSIAGSFNGWKAGTHPLTDPDGDGTWSAVLALPPGRHEYTLLLDGQPPFRGARIAPAHWRAYQSHEPAEMALHWLLPVYVCRLRPDGTLARSPENPALDAMLKASRIRFNDTRGLYEEDYRRALELNATALRLAPRDAFLFHQRRGLEYLHELEQIRLALRGAIVERDLESVLLPWLRSEAAEPADRKALQDLLRDLRAGGSVEGFRAQAGTIAVRIWSRERFPKALEEWQEHPWDEHRIHRLRRLAIDSFGLREPGVAREWIERLAPYMRGDPGAEALNALSDARLTMSGQGSWQAGGEKMLAWIRRHGYPPVLAAGGDSLLPRTREGAAGLWTLERLSDRPDWQRDYLHRELASSPRLRDEPGVDRLLAQALEREKDPLIAGRLASRLAYVYLVSRRENEYYALLERRLKLDPGDLELLDNFEAFYATLESIERTYAGLVANPWRPGLAAGLDRLERAAPENPVLLRLMARRFAADGQTGKASQLLRRILSATPWDAGAAIELARIEGGAEALEACWKARPGSARLARELGTTLRAEKLGEFLRGRFATTELRDAAVCGAVEGLRATTSATEAMRVLREAGPSASACLQRAIIRLAAEADRLPQVSVPNVAETLWYARLAALAWGREKAANEFTRRALGLERRRGWLVELLDEPEGRTLARDQLGKSGAAPFARFLVRDALARGEPAAALAPLLELERLAMLPEDARSARAGIALAELGSGRIMPAAAMLLRMAREDEGAATFFLVAWLLPLAFAWGLAGRRAG